MVLALITLDLSTVEVQFPHVSDALLEQLGYEKKNRYSASSFKVGYVVMVAMLLSIYSLPSIQVTPRKPAPDFKNVNAVINEKFEKVSLNDYRGESAERVWSYSSAAVWTKSSDGQANGSFCSSTRSTLRSCAPRRL